MKTLLTPSGFNLFGLNIEYYGLLIAIGICIALFVACKNTNKRGLTSDDIYLLALYCIPLAILGARTYYVLFSSESFTFVEFWKIWEGGLAIYGGILGGALGATLFCIIHKKNFFAMADVACISLILGQAIGRIGCYFAGCCYGIEVTNSAFMWFPFATKIGGVWHYSTFFYESILNFIIFGVLLYLIQKKVKTKGVIFSIYLISYGVVRAIIETFRGDSLYLLGMKVSQLLSILLIIAGIILLVIIYTKGRKTTQNEKNNNLKNNSNN